VDRANKLFDREERWTLGQVLQGGHCVVSDPKGKLSLSSALLGEMAPNGRGEEKRTWYLSINFFKSFLKATMAATGTAVFPGTKAA